MKNLLKAIIVAFLILTGFIFIGITIYSSKNKTLYKKVDIYARSEYELLNLPNELVEHEEIDLDSQGCHYDYKVGSMRCRTRRVKYFVSENDPQDEYNRINNYLTSLGWIHKYNEVDAKGAERLKNAGYLPNETYTKGELYDLELFLRFLDENDYNENPSFESNKKTNELIEEYYRAGKTLYKISVTTDFVR